LKEGLLSQRRIYRYFDADFVPQKTGSIKPSLILKSKIGVVQTHWGHTCNYSMTKNSGFCLDAHFTLEQVGRNSKLHFINFNGTAGYGEAMYSGCGNWESDTLTEDLDLSYRAQLKTGNSNISKMWLPAELPAIISATFPTI
jgi:hypothetical protein